MNEDALTNYLIKLFNVKDIGKVKPFSKFKTPPHEIGKEVTVIVTLKGNGVITVPNSPGSYEPRKPHKNQKYNLEDVAPHAMIIKHVKNESNNYLNVKKLYKPIFVTEEDYTEGIIEAMGGVIGCLNITPKFDGYKRVPIILEEGDSLYLKPSFIKTFMHINEQNIMNGIIPIHPELCGLAKLPKKAQVFNKERQSIEFDVDYYVLVPYFHILAWSLRVDEQWRKYKGLFALEFTLADKGSKTYSILYYIVANQTFDKLKSDCFKNFMDKKIDRMPLSKVGLEIVGDGKAKLSVAVSFVSFPPISDEEKSNFIPTLDNLFPPYMDTLRLELEQNKKEND